MRLLKSRTVGFYLGFSGTCLALMGVVAYIIALADAGTTANELVAVVIASALAGALIEGAAILRPQLRGLRAIVPMAYSLSFAGLAYNLVFYIIAVSSKLAAYLSPAKVAAAALMGVAALCACVSVFMREYKGIA